MVYDGHGPHGFHKDGLIQELQQVDHWHDEAYTYVSDQDIASAEKLLKDKGIFA